MKRIVLTIAAFLVCLISDAQKMTAEQYISTYKDLAVAEMIRSGVPASITLAQGLLETENGNSELVKKSNNHFGIKCKADWAGQTVYHDDDENGECFRKYDSAIFSYRDHSDFLRTRSHYAFLFSLDPTDFRGWAYGLKKAGYATNPQYPEILIKSIEENRLDSITESTLNRIPDYSVYRIEPVKSRISVVEKSLKKLESLVQPDLPSAKTYNGLKGVYADSGVSLLAIATKFDIPLSNLLDYNDLIDDGMLDKSQWIYLERKGTEGRQFAYTVKDNESLYEISQACAIQLSYLLAYNGLEVDDVARPGMVLQLKSYVSEKNSKTSSKKEKLNKKQKNIEDKNTDEDEKVIVKTHRVRPGETLETIAKKYKVTVSGLKKSNHLKSSRLKIGQKLIIEK